MFESSAEAPSANIHSKITRWLLQCGVIAVGYELQFSIIFRRMMVFEDDKKYNAQVEKAEDATKAARTVYEVSKKQLDEEGKEAQG